MNTVHVPTSWRFVSRDSSATNAVTWRRKSNRTARAAYKANVFTAGMSVIAPKRQTSVKRTYALQLNKMSTNGELAIIMMGVFLKSYVS